MPAFIPRGRQKPPLGAQINVQHPFAKGHVLSMLFNAPQSTYGLIVPEFGTAPRRSILLTPPFSSFWTATPHGTALQMVTSDYYDLGDSTFLPTAAITVLVVRKKTDTTNRNPGILFEAALATPSTEICRVSAPFSDGTVYWDFGKNGAFLAPNRLSVAGLSFSTTVPERWIFTAGPNGSAIWQNGIKVASQTTAITRTSNATAHLLLNQSSAGTFSGDNVQWQFLSILDYQWPDELCRWWSAEPYAHLYREHLRRYWLLPVEAPPAVPVPVPEDPCTIRTPRWAVGLRLFHSEDGDTGVGYIGKMYGKGPMRDPATYYNGYKEPRLLDAGTVRMAASDWLTGAVPAQSLTVRLADTDRYLRTQMDGAHPTPGLFPPSLSNKSQLYLYLVADATRRALSTDWRLLFRGVISEDPLSEHLTWSPTAKDVFGADYHLFRDDKMIPQRTISNNDFPSYPDSSAQNGVPIIGGNVTDEATTNVGKIKLIYVGNVTVNGLTKACGLLSGHANKAIRLYQDGTEIPTSDANAWWPGSANWTDFSPSNLKYVDINSRRYSLAFFDGTRATDFVSGDKPIYANVQGLTTTADGNGALITDYFALYYHLCTQWLSQSYLTGNWAAAPSFPFVPKPTTLDPDPAFVNVFLESSFSTASATFLANFGVSPVGAFVLGANGRRQSIRQVLADLNLTGNCLIAPNQYSQLMVNVLNLNRTALLASSRSVGKRDILRQPAFRVDRMRDWLGNHFAYRYGPNYRDDNGPEFSGSNEIIHTVSDHLYGRVDVSRTYMMTDHAGTADAVGQAQLNFGAHPRNVPTWGQSLCALANPLLTGVSLTHYAGATATGWTNRALWMIGQDVDTAACRVTCRAIDVDDLVS